MLYRYVLIWTKSQVSHIVAHKREMYIFFVVTISYSCDLLISLHSAHSICLIGNLSWRLSMPVYRSEVCTVQKAVSSFHRLNSINRKVAKSNSKYFNHTANGRRKINTTRITSRWEKNMNWKTCVLLSQYKRVEKKINDYRMDHSEFNALQMNTCNWIYFISNSNQIKSFVICV